MDSRNSQLHSILNINEKIAALKQEKWGIEEKLFEFEKDHLMLNDEHAPSQIDFEKKIDYWLSRISKLTLQDKEKIKNDLEKYQKELSAVIGKVKESTRELDALNTAIRKDNAKIREIHQAIKAISNEKEKAAIIATLDGKISLYIVLGLYESLKQATENALLASLRRATGKEKITRSMLSDISLSADFDKLLKYLNYELTKELMESAKKDADKLTEKEINEKMESSAEHFLSSIKSKLSIKEFVNENQVLDELRTFLMTEIYLLFVIETFKFTDDVQMGVTMAQARFAKGLTLNQVRNPFLIMPFAAKRAQINEGLAGLIKEAAVWLQGLFDRSFNQIPPFLKENGRLKDIALSYISDSEDRDLNYWKSPLTKMQMAEKHGEHSEALNSLLPLSVDATLPLDASCLFPEKTRGEIAQSEDENRVFSNTTSTNTTDTPSRVSNVKRFSQEPKNILPQYSLLSGSKKNNTSLTPPPEFLPLSKLRAIENDNMNVKYTFLQTYMDEYSLNPAQENVILAYKELIVENLSSYTDVKVNFKLKVIPVPTFIWARPHTNPFKNAIEIIQKSEDPKVYVKTVIGLLAHTVTGNESAKTVREILDNIFTFLIKSATDNSLEAEKTENLPSSSFRFK